MKVIKEGRQQKGWAKECICTGAGNEGNGCEAVLLVEQDDLFKTFHYFRDEKDTFVTFKCPQCGLFTDINNWPEEVPDSVFSKLKSFETWKRRNKQKPPPIPSSGRTS
jgi:hypothetical protein